LQKSFVFPALDSCVNLNSNRAWALATITLITLLPALSVALSLRKVEPQANTPVVPSIVAIGLVLLGAGLGWLAN
jgi:hypothetical protein